MTLEGRDPPDYWPEEALVGLAEAVRCGTPWREALTRAIQPGEPPDYAGQVTDDARGNWLWFADLSRWERALDVQGGVGTLTAALSRHFALVHYLDSARPLVSFAQTRFAADGPGNVRIVRAGSETLPYADATFDCVVWDGALKRWPPGADPTAVLRQVLGECRRVLRSGGCLYAGIAVAEWPVRPVGPGRALSWLARLLLPLAAAVPHSAGRRRATEHVRRLHRVAFPGMMRRLLQEAGFLRLEEFYIHPSFRQPWSMIPVRRRAVLAYESGQTVNVRLRRAIAWLGLHPLLYDARIFLAYP